MIKKFKEFINEHYSSSGKFNQGDLIYAPHEGHSGLIGLVISDAVIEDDHCCIYDVLFRGYAGEILQMEESDMVEIDHTNIKLLIDNDDLNMYKRIASRQGIEINPKYDILISEYNENEDEGVNIHDYADEFEENIMEKLSFKVNRILEKTGKIKLSDAEKSYLWGKLELKKKKKASEDENSALYKLL